MIDYLALAKGALKAFARALPVVIVLGVTLGGWAYGKVQSERLQAAQAQAQASAGLAEVQLAKLRRSVDNVRLLREALEAQNQQIEADRLAGEARDARIREAQGRLEEERGRSRRLQERLRSMELPEDCSGALAGAVEALEALEGMS